MKRIGRVLLGALVGLAVLSGTGCELTRQSRRPANDPPRPVAPMRKTIIDYVDSDAFDTLFETALINRDAVITIRTQSEKPDWTGRLNAWIAAWNMGKPGAPARTVRGQIPSIDGQTLREFRLLVESVVDRADIAAKNSATWWREERMRSRRVELLRSYSLRFHMNEMGRIELIFFNGDYAREFPQFLAGLTDNADGDAWSRRLEFSHCRNYRARQASLGRPANVPDNALRNLADADVQDWSLGPAPSSPVSGARRVGLDFSESSEAPPKR